jgi:hypothetical protein
LSLANDYSSRLVEIPRPGIDAITHRRANVVPELPPHSVFTQARPDTCRCLFEPRVDLSDIQDNETQCECYVLATVSFSENTECRCPR